MKALEEAQERRAAAKALVAEAFERIGIAPPEWQDNRHYGLHCTAERDGQEVLIQVTSYGSVEIDSVSGNGYRSVNYDDARKLAKSIVGRWKRGVATAAREKMEREQSITIWERRKAMHAEAEAKLVAALGKDLAARATYIDVAYRPADFLRCDVTVYANSAQGSKIKATCVSPEEAVQLVHTLAGAGWTFPDEEV